MNWGQSVTVPAEARRKIIQLSRAHSVRPVDGSHLPYFVAALAALNGWLLWRQRIRKRASRVTA
jgi:hypothetical protein